MSKPLMSFTCKRTLEEEKRRERNRKRDGVRKASEEKTNDFSCPTFSLKLHPLNRILLGAVLPTYPTTSPSLFLSLTLYPLISALLSHTHLNHRWSLSLLNLNFTSFTVNYFIWLIILSSSPRDLSARLGLKDGWKEALSALAVGGVPTFVFSSGHGDVISQVI